MKKIILLFTGFDLLSLHTQSYECGDNRKTKSHQTTVGRDRQGNVRAYRNGGHEALYQAE